MYIPRQYFVIGKEHVNCAFVRAFGKTWPVSGFMGRIFKRDIGKIVYLVGDILQVENDAQRAKRLGREVSQ